MISFKKNMVVILCSLSTLLCSGQVSLEYSVNFNETKKPGQSQVFKLDANEEVPFTGISAFVLRENVDVELFYKVKFKEGWTEWRAFALFTEGHTEGRTTFEGPTIARAFTAIQLKISQPMDADFTFRLYYPEAKKKSEVTSKTSVTGAVCNCAQPLVCQRNCWCPSGTCPKDLTPAYTQPTHIIVHHSAGSNSSADWAAVVGYIWDLHVNTNGWDDIGYNWLIDPDGVVYEGRGDSVLGAHFSCMNSGTTAICLLGNFMTTAPTDSAIQSLVEMITWEACDKNIDPDGSSFHSSSQLLLPNVAGHRHGNVSTAPNGCPKGTVCPGDSLFDLFPMLRDSAASNPCLGDVWLAEISKEVNGISLFPNPVGGLLSLQLNFKAPAISPVVRVFDATGKVVLKKFLKVNGNETVELGVGHLAPGIYVLEVSSQSAWAASQFVKK